MRYLVFGILLFTISCAPTMQQSGLSLYQVHNNTIVSQHVFTPSLQREIDRMPASLRPAEDDYLTSSVDLNNDGKYDILAIINHYKFSKDGKFKLHAFIKQEYSYLELSPQPFVSPMNIKVLTSVTNGYRDIEADGVTYTFSDSSYK